MRANATSWMVPTVCGLLGWVGWMSAAQAAPDILCDNTGQFPCGFQIKDVGLQPVPGMLKFQARVSQAKMPVGDGVFNHVFVNLKRGDETLCQEEFTGVTVANSVVNLEIGRNISCDLDSVIAENVDLAFQLCLGGTENCLRPIALGTSPYAVKSTFAVHAQDAFIAEQAAQANYAHRVTADKDLFISKELGRGYFDFFTPRSRPTNLYDTDAKFTPYVNGGFIQWTPTNEQNPTLHISAKTRVGDTLIPLDKTVIVSNNLELTGRTVVDNGGIHVKGASDITGNTMIVGQLKVERPGLGSGGALISGNSSIAGMLVVSDALTVQSNGLNVTGLSTLGGDLHVVGNQTVDGNTALNGALTVLNGATVQAGGVNVTGNSAYNGNMLVTGNLSVTGSVSFPPGAISVTGAMLDFDIPGQLTLGSGANQGTALSAGTGDTLFINSGSSFGGGTSVIGALTAGTLTTPGVVTASSVETTGGITTHLGGGWLGFGGSSAISRDTGNNRIVINGGNVGYTYVAGNLTADSITSTGSLSASSISTGGSLSAVSITTSSLSTGSGDVTAGGVNAAFFRGGAYYVNGLHALGNYNTNYLDLNALSQFSNGVYAHGTLKADLIYAGDRTVARFPEYIAEYSVTCTSANTSSWLNQPFTNPAEVICIPGEQSQDTSNGNKMKGGCGVFRVAGTGWQVIAWNWNQVDQVKCSMNCFRF